MSNVKQKKHEMEFYLEKDFRNVKKIDMHLHVNTDELSLIEQALEDNFKILTINVDYPAFPPVEKQFNIATSLSKRYPDILAFATTFYMEGWDDPGWQKKTIKYIEEKIQLGACAVKVWKNIGMDFRDNNGNLIMIDHPKFDSIFKAIKELGVPLIGHLGEPKDCWLPVNEMIVNYVRDYFTQHPEYHMYAHPELPSYEDQIKARNKMLEKNMDIFFIGAHFASLEWNVDELAKFLDRFPLACVDSAARMGEIQYQTIYNRDKVRDFFIKYQNRIMYATDTFQEPGMDKQKFQIDVHNKWISDWNYFTNNKTMSVSDLSSPFKGLKLPKKVVDKIYRTNALRIFSNAWKS